MNVNLIRDNGDPVPTADVNIVIDVLRAFTTMHVAFENGLKRAILVGRVEDALALKQVQPEAFLVGETDGFPILGFDCGNSPHHIAQHALKDRTMIFRTTNGVRVTLNALDAPFVFVVGLVNAKATCRHVLGLTKRKAISTVNIIASGKDDDDWACAEYMAGILAPEQWPEMSLVAVSQRIRNSRTAAKFLNKESLEFPLEDLDAAAREVENGILMAVLKSGTPEIVRVF